jgi:hypothetical protein
MTGELCEKTDGIDANTSHTPEEGAHSPSWPKGRTVITVHIRKLYKFTHQEIDQRARTPPREDYIRESA